MESNAPSTTQIPPKKRRIRLRWRRLAIAFLVLLLVGELALRLIFGLGNPVIYQVDQYIGYMPAPNQDIVRFFSRNKINAFNQRSDDLPAHKEAGHFRALFIGDSMIYGTTYVDQAKIATSILARELPAIVGKPVDVMNASAGGWAVFNESHYLQARGTYDADLVVFVINAGDLVQPFNTLAPEGDLNYPVHKPWTAIGETWSRYLAPRLLHTTGIKQDAGVAVPVAPDFQTETTKVAAELSAAHRFCQEHNARMSVVYLGAADPMWKPGVEILTAWARGENVPLVDYTAVFSAYSTTDIFYNLHFTPKGNEVLAHQVEKDWPLLAK